MGCKTCAKIKEICCEKANKLSIGDKANEYWTILKEMLKLEKEIDDE